jgi:DNA-binding NarL/FixJ family response regulator
VTVRVLVVDDQAVVRAGFRTILGEQDDLEVVGEAADGREAVRATAALTPDVVLMDVRMPVMDGLEATRRVTALPDPPRVLVLTTFNLDEYVFAALRAGASGFLLKDVLPAEVVAGVRVVASGEGLLAPSATRRLIEVYLDGGDPAAGDERARLALLTAREREVLELAARGMSNAEIADVLVVGESTVKTHMTSLLSKLHLRDRVQATIFAYDAGVVRAGR